MPLLDGFDFPALTEALEKIQSPPDMAGGGVQAAGREDAPAQRRQPVGDLVGGAEERDDQVSKRLKIDRRERVKKSSIEAKRCHHYLQ